MFELFTELTPEQRALLILRLRKISADGDGPGSQAVTIKPVSRDRDLPLSFAQQRLWIIAQMEPDSFAYNISTTIRLTGRLQIAALEQSLSEIIRRHEVLRTTFPAAGGRPVQVIAPSQSLTLQVVDLSGLSDQDQQTKARQLATEETRRPFDLAQDSLLRVTLVWLGGQAQVIPFTLHHIVSDGWSLGILTREVATLYEAFVIGEPSPLPKLAIQYADFAVWQREWLQGEVLNAQIAYWKQRLTGIPPALALLTDRPRPAVQTFRGARQSMAPSKLLTEGCRALSQREGVTLFMTLLTAFNVLLYRYTSQADILVGTPIANRSLKETEDLIGFFVNTLVMRTDLTGDPNIRELLERVREVAIGAYAHQDLPFERLVEELHPERAASHSPLFQVMFVLQNAPQESLTLPNLKLSSLSIEGEASMFDLCLDVAESVGDLKVSLTYNTDLYDKATIVRLLGHFRTLLEGILADPERRLSEAPLMPESERDQILVEWNDTEREYGEGSTLHELFERQVERTPDGVAVVYQEQALTYRELNRRANHLAHYLVTIGVGPGARVGICLERCVEMVVGLMGVIKAGGAYVPLDPTYPLQRLTYYIEDARMTVVVTERRLCEKLPENATRILLIDEDWERIAGGSEENVWWTSHPRNPAYVIYTSGSTGKPKGAELEHRGWLNLIQWFVRDFSISASDRFLLVTSFSFDLTQKNFIAPLVIGGTLYLLDSPFFEPTIINRAIYQNRITILNCTPTGFYSLIENGGDEPFSHLSPLRYVFLGGEPISITRLSNWLRSTANITEVVNTYGPTECTDISAAFRVDPCSNKPSPIGRPIFNAQLFILDRYFQPLPVGAAGELFISGAGLGRDYLAQPTMTAESFIPHPFSMERGARMYRTGDMARYLPDGNVEFLERVDHQVKIRGYRIELGEIEAALMEHASVRQCVVCVREERPGERRLVAYLVVKPEAGVSVSDLRTYLSERLPRYMAPAAIVVLDALPIGATGKLDRQALPAPEQLSSELKEAPGAPRTSGERLLADIWTEFLNLKQVGIHDNFFELGGDSILAIQITARANQAGLRLTPMQVFQYQTIAGLIEVVGTAPETQAEQNPVTGLAPLTPIQRRFLDQNIQDSHHFNQALLLETRRDLIPQLLHEVIEHLLVRHDALRLRFVRDDGAWRQFHVDPGGTAPLVQVDLTALSEDERGVVMAELTAQLQASLDLSAGPLMRSALFELGRERGQRLLLVIHHLVVDGVSWRILLEELQSGYEQLSRGQEIGFGPKTTSFKEWAERMSEHARQGGFDGEVGYWLSESTGQARSLPVDYEMGANTVASAQSVRVTLDEKRTRELLEEVPRAYNTKINDVLLTALWQVLSKWTGSGAVLVDVEGHGRETWWEDVDLSRTMGWFTALYPVRLEVAEGSNLGQTLKSVKEQLREVQGRGLSYGWLRYASDKAEVVKRLDAQPQPQVTFNYLGQFDQTLPPESLFGWARESSGPGRSRRGQRSHLLDIDVTLLERQLHLSWIYSENVHRRETMESIVEEYLQSLQSLIAHCLSADVGDYTPSDFPEANLTQEELTDLLAELSDVVGE